MTLSRWKTQFPSFRMTFIGLFGLLTGCMAEVKSQSNDKNTVDLSNETKRKLARDSMTEWLAFSVFHPESALSEDSFGLSLTTHSHSGIMEENLASKSQKANDFSVILGANALIPILRSTFGNQARSSDSPDENSWFTTHPSDLFTPSELLNLCSNLKFTHFDETDDICWRPKLTQGYLVSLTNFAADACTKLVERENKSEDLNSNKLLRGKPFTNDHLHYFSLLYLKIPKQSLTNEWLKKISDDATSYLKEELKIESMDSPESTSVVSIEKAIFSCRAAITSKEFYSR